MLVIAYLVLSINTYLETQALGAPLGFEPGGLGVTVLGAVRRRANSDS